MPAGRPLKYQDINKLQQDIDAYFALCDKGKEIEVYDKKTQEVKKITVPIPYTITGLAMALDTYRQTLLNYEVKEEFMDTIKKAKQRVENYAELRLMKGDLFPASAIFALKNHGWKDQQEIKIDPESRITTTMTLDDATAAYLDALK
jgi:transcriptional regulator of met regulon